MIKKIIHKIINKTGYVLIKKGIKPVATKYTDPMIEGLKRSEKNISSINTIIDVGAAAGTWYEKSIQVWPNSNYILFEPLAERRFELEELKKSNSKINLRFSALGDQKSKLKFTVSDDLDGSGFYGRGNQREVDVEALDDVLSETKLHGPYILKLDTHGFELPIFKGASETLKNTELIIVEVYGFYVAPNSVLFWEICKYLEENGFRLFDIVDVMRRKKDGAFWQCDAFFLKSTNSVFSSNSYQ